MRSRGGEFSTGDLGRFTPALTHKMCEFQHPARGAGVPFRMGAGSQSPREDRDSVQLSRPSSPRWQA